MCCNPVYLPMFNIKSEAKYRFSIIFNDDRFRKVSYELIYFINDTTSLDTFYKSI